MINANNKKSNRVARIVIALLIVGLFCLLFYFISSFLIKDYNKKQKFIDITKLTNADTLWQVESIDTSFNRGCIKLINQKWLMHFIHWYTLTEENREISIDYIKKKMLTLWGPSMPFTLSPGGGDTLVNGHKAFYADGSLYDGKVKTRFIIWNCEESQRQFISDCNINLEMHTPIYYLKLQYVNVTQSIQCHNPQKTSLNDIRNRNINMNEYNISFSIPVDWKSQEFRYDTNTLEYPYPGYYPNGINCNQGSILSVLRDSEKRVQLRWLKTNETDKMKLLNKFIKIVKEDTLFSMIDTFDVAYNISNIILDSIYNHDNLLTVSGIYDYEMNLVKYSYNEINKYRFKILLWQNGDRSYFLLTSIVLYDDMLGAPYKLIPSESLLDSFITNEIVPFIHEVNFRSEDIKTKSI